MRNPYDILGLAKTASLTDIKKAYRRLAKANHPDQSKDPKAKDRFNEATIAYDLLGDDKKRAAYDRGEIDGEGKPRHPGFGGGAGPGQPRGPSGFENFDFGGGARAGTRTFDAGDIFADLFASAGRGQTAGRAPQRGEDIEASLEISLNDLARGESVRVTLPSGRTLDVRIPREIEDGKQIRLKGQGQPAAIPGDLLINVHFSRHPLFTLDGRDVKLEWPITLYEAVLGAEIEVPTLQAGVQMKVPPGAHHGRAMRLRGKGLPSAGGAAGDLYVTLKIVLPKVIDTDFTALMQKWRDDAPYDPRKG